MSRLNGDAFRVPLLEQWKLVGTDQPFSSEGCRTGDGSYLLTARDKNGQLAIVMVRDTCFSLLPTVCPIPMRSQWGTIFYQGPAIVDRERQQGYVMGVDSLNRRQYLLAIDLTSRPSSLTLYYTDTLEHATTIIPVITPDGDLILAGGVHKDNYKPFSAVWLYRFATERNTEASSKMPLALSIIALLAIAALAYLLLYLRRRRSPVADNASMRCDSEDDSGDATLGSVAHYDVDELLERICQYMDEQQPYLQSRLRQSDVAATLGVSTTSISECLTTCRGITFAQFIAEYRVRHAQRLLSNQPDTKLSAVYAEAGFTSESTFFRTFKAITGLSPKEWLAQQ